MGRFRLRFSLAEKAVDGWDLFSVGYSTNLRIDLAGIWSADPDLDMVATLLRTTTSLQPLDHYGALAIIAHSMGGLAVQRAILDYPDLRGTRPERHPSSGHRAADSPKPASFGA